MRFERLTREPEKSNKTVRKNDEMDFDRARVIDGCFQMAFSQAHEVEPWFHKVIETEFFFPFFFFFFFSLRNARAVLENSFRSRRQGISAHDAVDVLERKESGSFLFRPSST
jgi:hypothetical protein